MLLIYTHKITPRFMYIMKQLFTRILGLEILFTTKVEDFIKHTGPKITYTKQPLQNEFFIRSNGLLFENGINDINISMGQWEGVPCFFSTGEGSVLPYDIFAASFYLLSRYEEYVPHVKDVYGRFSYKESLAHQHNFLHLPVIDLWTQKLWLLLKERFPDIDKEPKKVRCTSIIDVTTSHSYAMRGFFRGISGLLLDIGTFQLRRVGKRIMVWLNLAKDPFDNFSTLIELHKKYKSTCMFFFQFAQYSRYDKNISTENNKFQHLIKSVADYHGVSLAASFSSFSNINLLKLEKKNLSTVINRPVNYSRLRYNRVDIPETYRNLVEAEFTDDYSMGYTHELGFKAGTCTSFYFYDIPLEIQQPIKVHPFAVHDYALLKFSKEEEVIREIGLLFEQVTKVNGHFMTVFSNELLGSHQKFNWLKLYKKILEKYHV